MRYMPASLQNLISFVVLVVVLIALPRGIVGYRCARCAVAKSAAYALIVVAALSAVPFLAARSEYAIEVLFLIFLYGAMATAWNLLGGFAGQVSFGHAAFLGIGAYVDDDPDDERRLAVARRAGVCLARWAVLAGDRDSGVSPARTVLLDRHDRDRRGDAFDRAQLDLADRRRVGADARERAAAACSSTSQRSRC